MEVFWKVAAKSKTAAKAKAKANAAIAKSTAKKRAAGAPDQGTDGNGDELAAVTVDTVDELAVEESAHYSQKLGR